jgi:hypothetical protein
LPSRDSPLKVIEENYLSLIEKDSAIDELYAIFEVNRRGLNHDE